MKSNVKILGMVNLGANEKKYNEFLRKQPKQKPKFIPTLNQWQYKLNTTGDNIKGSVQVIKID